MLYEPISRLPFLIFAGRRQAKTYIESLWENGDDNVPRLFFGEKRHFIRQMSIEQERLLSSDLQAENHRIRYRKKGLEDLPRYVLRLVCNTRKRDY